MIAPELRERLLTSWRAWDEHPGLERTTAELHAAEQAVAADLGVTVLLLHDLLVALRRAGWSYEDALAGTERALIREET